MAVNERGRKRYVVLLAAAVVLAGCLSPQARRPDLTELPRADVSPGANLSAAIDVPAVGLNVSELPNSTAVPYVVAQNKYIEASDSNVDAIMLKRQGILESLTRVLAVNGSNGTAKAPTPAMVLSSVRLFLNASNAASRLETLRTQAQQSGGNVSWTKIHGVNVTVIQVIPSTGYRNVLYMVQDRNLLYYVMTADKDSFFPDFARTVFRPVVEDATAEMNTSVIGR